MTVSKDTKRNIDRTARAAREMGEIQHDAYEALTENFAALQRRNLEFAQDGLEFVRLQEDNARAVREWWMSGIELARLQQRNVNFAQKWLTGGIGLLRDQTEHNLRTAEVFARSVREQQESFRKLAENWNVSYRDYFFAPFDYARRGLEAAQQVTEQATRQGIEATQQVTEQATEQGLRLAEESAAQTTRFVRKSAEATRQAELKTAVHAALRTQDYDALTVDEISGRLEGLPVDSLKKIREYEKQNKNRETLIEQLDRKIKATS